ncbi:HAD hydrolase family protein [Olsenella sp. AM04-33]|uniref:HAD hydrolase family protein n=1 Tax=Olsenella sp. AM04-33 TaxID=2292049 RepID=UPI002570CE6D|nr:HAD hydrolase family protein [Olsenella sp. AM04-33]
MAECVTAFFDIDGTLGWTDPVAREQMSDDKRKLSPVPSPVVADAIRRFVAAGNRAFICTGRSQLDIHPKMAALPFSGMACLAGAYVKVGDVVLRDVALPPEVLTCVDEVLLETGTGALLESACGSIDVRGGAAGTHQPSPGSVAEALELIPGRRAHKVVLPTPAARLVVERLAGVVDLSIMELELGNSEVGLRENCKSGAVRAILDYLGDAGTTYGFGDSENDLSLFEQVDVPVAMGNASPEVKAAAAMVTDTVGNDGVAKALAKLGLI